MLFWDFNGKGQRLRELSQKQKGWEKQDGGKPSKRKSLYALHAYAHSSQSYYVIPSARLQSGQFFHKFYF